MHKFSHELSSNFDQIGLSSFNFLSNHHQIASNQDRQRSSDEVDFGLDQTTHFGVTCP